MQIGLSRGGGGGSALPPPSRSVSIYQVKLTQLLIEHNTYMAI